jgi:hypothetical protein
MIVTSNIHGIGAQNFFSAMRNGCSDVFGMVLGPTFSRFTRTSSLVSPILLVESPVLLEVGPAGAVLSGGILSPKIDHHQFAVKVSRRHNMHLYGSAHGVRDTVYSPMKAGCNLHCAGNIIVARVGNFFA